MPVAKKQVCKHTLQLPTARITAGGRILQLWITLSIWGLAVVFGWMCFDLINAGVSELSWSFLFDSPSHSGLEGGIAPILVSTGLVLACTMVVATPISVAIALLLVEHLSLEGGLAKWLRVILLLLAGMPSVVFGLVGASFFGDFLGLGTSIITGGLTLAMMTVPTFVFALVEILHLLPRQIRYAGVALGAYPVSVLCRVVLRIIRPGIVGAFLVSTGRALGETAALIFTSGYSDRMPLGIFDSGRVLSIHILELSMNIPGGEPRASAAAIALMSLFLLFSGGVALFGANGFWGVSYAR